MGNAPADIWAAYDAITVPSHVMSGILGDAAHSFGYHLPPNELPATDYSVILPRDARGAKLHSSDASALDIKFDASHMVLVTNRLLAAAQSKDYRLSGLREFCGTTDDLRTHPYDLSSGQDGPLDSWDASHLWHVHLSFYRDATPVEMLRVASVINGDPLPTPPLPVSEGEELMRFRKSTDGAIWFVNANGRFVEVNKDAAAVIAASYGIPGNITGSVVPRGTIMAADNYAKAYS